MKTTFVIAASAFLLAAPALAQEPATAPDAPEADVFVSIDADADGALSLEEVQKVDEQVTEADFAKYDADDSATLSKMEFANWTADIKASSEASAGE